MSRQEDFNTQSDKYVEGRKSFGVNDPYTLKEIGEAHYQGAEHGYQYAKKRLGEVLGFELDFNVAEFDDGVTTESLVDKIFKRMEE